VAFRILKDCQRIASIRTEIHQKGLFKKQMEVNTWNWRPC